MTTKWHTEVTLLESRIEALQEEVAELQRANDRLSADLKRSNVALGLAVDEQHKAERACELAALAGRMR